MTAAQAKTALDKAIKPVAFAVFKEKAEGKLELLIGSTAKDKAKEIEKKNPALLEGRGSCHLENADTVIFSAKKATFNAKSLIKLLCGASYGKVLFGEVADASADVSGEGSADASGEGNAAASGEGSEDDSSGPLPMTTSIPANTPAPQAQFQRAQAQPAQPGDQSARTGPQLGRRPGGILDPQTRAAATTAATQGVQAQTQNTPRAWNNAQPSRQVPPPRNPGLASLGKRQAAELAGASAASAEAARVSFQPNFAKKCAQSLNPPPITMRPDALLDIAGLENHHNDRIREASKQEVKDRRIETMMKEQAASRKFQTAVEDFQNNGGALSSLETVCVETVTFFKQGCKAELKKLDDGIRDASKEDKQDARDNKTAWAQGPVAKRLLASADALLQVKLQTNGTTRADLDLALAAAETSKTEATVEQVMAMTKKYGAMYREHADTYQSVFRGASGNTRSPEAIRQEGILDGVYSVAEKTLFELKRARLGPPPWQGDKARDGVDLVDLGRQIQAKSALHKGDILSQMNGMSDVLVIGNGGGKVAFAFKSAEGENDQAGLPRGGGAIREAVTSRIFETVLKQTGFDFGFPQASIATIGGKPGALVEGVNGRELPERGKVVRMSDEQKAEIAAFQNGLPGKELQKTVCAGLMTGNFMDLKWDNVFWEGEGATAKARPFDAGAGFPPSETLDYQMYGRPGDDGFEVLLLSDAHAQPTKGATEPMDQEIVDTMLAIKVEDIIRAINDEKKRNEANGLGALLDVDSARNGLKTLQATQAVLKKYEADLAAAQQAGDTAAQRPSLIQFVDDMKKEILRIFPKS